MIKPNDQGQPQEAGAVSKPPPAAEKKPPKAHKYLFKFLLLGDKGVGKSALLQRYSRGSFTEHHQTPIGVDFDIKSVELTNGDVVKHQIWDITADERFRTISSAYCRGTKCIIIAYDVTRQETADQVAYWVEQCLKHAADDVIIAVAGNKSDISGSSFVDKLRNPNVKLAEVNKDELKDKVQGLYEVSSKTGHGVEEMFGTLTDILVTKKQEK